MTLFEISHKVVSEYYIGEVEAEDRDDALNKAMNMLPLSKEDYDYSEDLIIEEVEE